MFESETYKSDRMRSIGFAINARSMPVADTLYLDPYYVSFLEKTAGHAHARVRMVAGESLRQLPEMGSHDRKYYPARSASAEFRMGCHHNGPASARQRPGYTPTMGKLPTKRS